MITTLNKWCNRCDIEHTEYRAIYREIYSQTPKWSQPNGTEWVQDVCHECLTELKDKADMGTIWSLSYTRRFSNYTWKYPQVEVAQ